jgi:signal peptidase
MEGGWRGVLKRYRVLFGSVLVVALLLVALLVYSGIWPPVYVVESASMQHSDTKSRLGIIDTGDMVIVQRSDGTGVRTYVECYPDGDRSFGDYGDVIIYHRYGLADVTPVIHRAMVRLVYNSTGPSFDVPSLAALPAEKWGNGMSPDGQWWALEGVVEIFDVGYRSATLRVDLAALLSFYMNYGLSHDGIITMGDHNVNLVGNEWLGIYDQASPTICREPIKDEWIVAEARAEIPWLGLIKLYVGGNLPPDTPENSKTGLLAVLVLVIVVPLALDLTVGVLHKRGIHPWSELKKRFKREKG